MRRAEEERETDETYVEIEVALDAEGGIEGSSGVPFLDHVLDSLSVHGSLSVDLEVSGDEDPHHRAEDIAIVLGRALRRGAGRRVRRFGDARVPMDEAIATVALDFGGRSYSSARLPEGEVDGLPTSLFEHFVRSLANSAGATIHLEAEGEDTHHVVEAAFKALGLALEEALRESSDVRSTKGVLD